MRHISFLYSPHIELKHRSHVRELSCYVIKEAEGSPKRHKLQSNTVPSSQSFAAM
jgi:hypothetical protein